MLFPIRNDQVGRFIRRTALVVAIISGIGFWLARANEPDPAALDISPEQIERAKKHAEFEKLAQAKTVVVGKIRARYEGADEIFPPVHHLTIFVTPTNVIAGDAEVGKRFAVPFSIQAEDEPAFDDVPYLVATQPSERGRRLLLIHKADDELTTVARAATADGQQQRAKNARLARENPEMHPLFDELQKVKQIALLRMSGNPNQGVAFDARTELEEQYNVTVVQTLRGDVKPGLLKVLHFTEEASPRNKQDALIAVLEIRDGKPVVTRTLAADEETVRVAAAVAETDSDTLLKKVGGAKANYRREVEAARARSILQGITDGIFGGGAGSSEDFEGEETLPFDPEQGADEFEEFVP